MIASRLCWNPTPTRQTDPPRDGRPFQAQSHFTHACRKLTFVLGLPANPQGTTIQVPQTLATPCEAVVSATLGDRIEIDAAYIYPLEACTINKNNLTIAGVNGRAILDGSVELSGETSFWMITGDNTVVENIEFINARNTSGDAIALFVEGTNLTVRDCRFVSNDNGLAVADNQLSDLLVEHSEFGGNGSNPSPNVNVGHINRFTFQFNYSHHALYGDLMTSRAAENFVLYNRLTEENGVSRHQINIPNGGLTYIIGNIIQTGNAQERNLVTYRMEGSDLRNPSEELLVVNNTFVNDTYFSMNFIEMENTIQIPSLVWNNIFSGDGVFVTQSNTNKQGSASGNNLNFVDPSNYDYRLQSTSSAIDAGFESGFYSGFDLTPHYHYVHPTSSESRTTVNLIDSGAFEFGDATGGSSPQPPTTATPKKVLLLFAKSMFVNKSLSGNIVILNQAADEDVIVILESEIPELVDMSPSSVTVPAGYLESEPFNISAGDGIKHPTQVKISATTGGVTKKTGIRVKPLHLSHKK